MNKRRTKQENVSVEFVDEEDGTTWGHVVASTDEYGADKLWVVLEPIAIDVTGEDETEDSDPPTPAPSSSGSSSV